MPAIANLLFDFGNVLLDIDIPHGRQELYRLVEGGEPSPALVREIEDVINHFDKGEVTSEEFVEAILTHAIEEVTPKQVIKAWNSMLQGIPNYRFGMLKALRDDFTLILHSNTNEIHIEWVHAYLDRAHKIRDFEKEYFDEAYYSFMMEKRKPEEEFYRHLIEDAMITPESSLFIDDMEANIKVAEKMGFQTLQIKPGEEVAEILKMKGYY